MSTAERKNLVITRILNAPRKRVFEAWTKPEQLKHWWGPKNFMTTFCEINLRVGGVNRFCMRSSGGQEFWSKGVYHEVLPPEKLVTTDSFSDAQGQIVPATYYGMSADIPSEMLITVTFKERNGKTELRLEHGPFSVSGREAVESGWNESFDRLDAWLSSERVGKAA